MLSSVRHRVLLLTISSLLAIALGFWLIPARLAVMLVQHWGYCAILATTAGFIVVLWRSLPESGFRSLWSPADVPLAVTCVIVAILWQIHGIHGFKILMDELVLNATAMSMHFEREAFVPLKTHLMDGSYATMAGIVDKRPLFFPFLVSVLHDVSGYRTGNVFVLNAVLSLLLLFFTGRMARRLGGKPLAGILAVLLLSGLPLLALNATGGGFEILNLVMILAVAALGRRYLENPEERGLDALILGTVLLAQTRYESVLFVPVVGVIVLIGWWQQRRPILSWGLIAAPVLMLPVPLLHRLFEINKGFWQLPEGDTGAFAWRHFSGNLGGAVEFLFTLDTISLGSPLLSLVGLVGLTFFFVYTLRRWRAVASDPVLLTFGLFMASVLAGFALLLCYHWGQLQDFVASRLGLPLLLWLALGAAFAIGRWTSRRAAWVPVLGVPTIWLLCGSLPAHVKSDDLQGFLSYQEVKWQREFVASRGESQDLFVLPSSLPAILDRRPALPVAALAERAAQTAFHLRLKTYQNVWVFQRFEFNPTGSTETPDPKSALGPGFILELIEERRFQPRYAMRLSRIKAVDLALVPPAKEGTATQFPPFSVSDAGPEASPENRFVHEFLTNLP